MLEEMYNDGERLILGETYDVLEVMRHRSRYT